MEITVPGENARDNQQGISRQEKSHKETCLDEDDQAYQERASGFNQALNVKYVMNKM